MPRGNAREKRAYGTQFSGNAQEAEATMNKAVNGLLLAHTVERAQPQLEVIKLLNSLVLPGLPECPVGAIIFGAEAFEFTALIDEKVRLYRRFQAVAPRPLFESVLTTAIFGQFAAPHHDAEGQAFVGRKQLAGADIANTRK